MGGYNFPGQIAASDGSEGNGSMDVGFIVLKNPKTTGSIRVDRTEEGTDSTRTEMTALLEVLIGANVNDNLVVMVDNQSIKFYGRSPGVLARGTEPSWYYR